MLEIRRFKLRPTFIKATVKMIDYENHSFTYEEEATAEKLKRNLLNKGVLTKDIRSEHIIDVYSSLNQISSAPNFISSNGLLPTKHDKIKEESPPVVGVIVETRRHKEIDFIVNNFINTLNIPVQIFHGNNNLDYIMSTSISDLVDKGLVHLTHLKTDSLCANKYNALFLSKIFWRHIIGRKKILVFQTDTFLCRSSDYRIEDFIEYDYIGSKWPRYRPVGLIIDGGNGGLSLRDWEKTYDCLGRFKPEYWSGGEDGYFAFHIDLMGGNVGRGNECANFSTESEFLSKSLGCHKISCLKIEDKTAFLNYCPEAKFMI